MASRAGRGRFALSCLCWRHRRHRARSPSQPVGIFQVQAVALVLFHLYLLRARHPVAGAGAPDLLRVAFFRPSARAAYRRGAGADPLYRGNVRRGVPWGRACDSPHAVGLLAEPGSCACAGLAQDRHSAGHALYPASLH